MPLKRAAIAGLQPPDIAEILALWRDQTYSSFTCAAAAYDTNPSLLAAHAVGTLHKLHQVFATTIPAVRGQRHGWRSKLNMLLKELRDAGVLES